MSGQWPPEWEDSDTGLPDEWTIDDAGPDPEASEVTLLLASVPSPVLPASFEARISAAIAAEATARASGTASADAGWPVSAGTVSAGTGPADAGMAAAETDDAKTTDRSSSPEFSPAAAESGAATAARHRRRRTAAASRGAARRSGPAGSRPGGRRRRFRLPAPAVTAPLLIVLIIAGFAIVFSQFSSGPTSSGSVAAAGAASAAPTGTTGAQSTGSGRYSDSGPQFEPSRPGKGGQNADFVVTESGTSYQGATLASQVRGQLGVLAPGGVTPAASSTVRGPASAAASASASSPAHLAPSTQLAGCVSRLTGGVTPRLVDRASYDGTPAYVIAVSSRAWVVRLGCTAADPQEITSVSLTGLSRESQRPRIG
jgi:hypothetical protein